MDDAQRTMLLRILTECRVLSLAVLVDEAPYAGQLPFAMRNDLGAFLIHASGLAHHTKGLGEGRPFGLVVSVPDHFFADPLQLPRVALQGTVRLLDRGTETYDASRRAYVEKFPESASHFGLGDFNLYALEPERGRLITGFGGAVNIGPRTLATLRPAP